MVVEKISTSEFDMRTIGLWPINDGFIHMTGVFISSDKLKAATAETWEYIRDSLNSMPPLKYCCKYERCGGVDGRRLYVLCETETPSDQVAEFLDTVLEDDVKIDIHFIDTFIGTANFDIPIGDGASCPLFSGVQ